MGGENPTIAIPGPTAAVILAALSDDGLAIANAGLKLSNTTIAALLDVAISTRAPTATALSTAQWTNVRAALLDRLDAAISTRATPADITAALNGTTTTTNPTLTGGGAWDTLTTIDTTGTGVLREYVLDFSLPTAVLVTYDIEILRLSGGTALEIVSIDATTEAKGRSYPIVKTDYLRVRIRQNAGVAQTIRYRIVAV